MKNKLKLAVFSILFPFVISMILNQFYYFIITKSADGIEHSILEAVSFITKFSPLGTLPFFISLYNNKEYRAIIENEEKNNINQNDNWIKHIIIRVGIILVICGLFFSLSLVSSGIDTGYIILYGILITIIVATIYLAIESIFLITKKLWNKLICNIILLAFVAYLIVSMS